MLTWYRLKISVRDIVSVRYRTSIFAVSDIRLYALKRYLIQADFFAEDRISGRSLCYGRRLIGSHYFSMGTGWAFIVVEVVGYIIVENICWYFAKRKVMRNNVLCCGCHVCGKGADCLFCLSHDAVVVGWSMCRIGIDAVCVFGDEKRRCRIWSGIYANMV